MVHLYLHRSVPRFLRPSSVRRLVCDQLRVATREIWHISMVAELKREMKAILVLQRIVRRRIVNKHFVVLQGIQGKSRAVKKEQVEKAVVMVQSVYRGKVGRERAKVRAKLRARRLGLLEDCLTVRSLITVAGTKVRCIPPKKQTVNGATPSFATCAILLIVDGSRLHVRVCSLFVYAYVSSCHDGKRAGRLLALNLTNGRLRQ